MNEGRRWMAWMLTGGIALFAVLFFFQTRDPMILIFGLVAIGILWAVMMSVGRGGAGAPDVRVRCPACRALNLEDAKFCSQCGRAL